MDYLALREQLEKRGLLNKTPWYYVRIIAIITTLFIAAWTAFYVFENIYIRMASVLALGFIGVQIGFLGHDAGHKAISNKQAVNSIIGYLSMTLVNGISWSYWSSHHNAHHKDPNYVDEDPDVKYLIAAFSPEQVQKKNKFTRWLIKRQSIFFVPMHFLTVFSMVINSTTHSIKKAKIADAGLMALHFALWIVIPGIFIGFGWATLFYVIAALLRGMYFAMVFVPNHVGMPMPKENLPFMEKQIMTARNITPSWLKDRFFGGLNYQIEHHLFPNTSRKHLRACRKIVKEFCLKNSIKYEEVGFFKCYKDVLSHVHKISKITN